MLSFYFIVILLRQIQFKLNATKRKSIPEPIHSSCSAKLFNWKDQFVFPEDGVIRIKGKLESHPERTDYALAQRSNEWLKETFIRRSHTGNIGAAVAHFQNTKAIEWRRAQS